MFQKIMSRLNSYMIKNRTLRFYSILIICCAVQLFEKAVQFNIHTPT